MTRIFEVGQVSHPAGTDPAPRLRALPFSAGRVPATAQSKVARQGLAALAARDLVAHAAATGAAVRHSQVHLGALGRLAWDALLVWLVLRFLGSHLGIGWIDYFEREDQAASWD